MIVTVTPNPSIDRTVTLPSPLTRGAVHRVTSVTDQAGGKGVNVARALSLAGLDALAVLPAASNDPLITALQAAAVSFRVVPAAEPARTNLTVTEPDGTTTKINEPGATLDAASVTALTDAVLAVADDADWVVMSGSLPPGMTASWYGDVVALLASRRCRVAVDTSDAPLAALVGALDRGAPDLIKPNAEELASVLGLSPEVLEQAVAQGDPEPVVAAARQLVDRGVGAVLATLGAEGAVLVDANGAWMASPPPIVPRSTVGAGDSSLAGYVRAEVGGAVPPQRLQMAVAYGSAAAALPGTTLPSPAEIDLAAVHVAPISPIPATQ
ncbi:1-phosphofructokinase family hexose kinase [Mycolicibacterium sp. 018/SC-01/001]|uniref:1-phosphofructokinase family hexose kinase n=1 Tax=Mycolicibacterium sp. 018/SC-01/001 TaxID=2592069 RepID=UPI00117E47DC|nr:1-phosphofructokinase family hexose kinase [Mycolicibacterium sp. 018/SC-01/001]TRW87766.1 1-phosphofructokinase family hexose kinase [Mycolicibacterium sp. 018/SC-01/001]